jgi:predicted ATPase
LRPEPSRFFGRLADLDRIDSAGSSSGASSRLVTIAGAGGIGKTRLAMRYAQTRAGDFAGVWFCDMRDARVPSDMTSTVLRAFAGDRAVHADSDAALARTLAARAGSLVILDNVEHLLPAAAQIIRRWVVSTPNVRFLVTSRVPLGVAIERVVELGGVEDADAVDLFVERVRSRMTGWAPSAGERESIAEISRRLAGLPLAIELAAARVASASAFDGPDLLAHVSASRLPAPDTALHRAFSLLHPAEREVIRSLSVFRGTFSLQSAVALAPKDIDARGIVVDLAAKNIIRVERHGPMRFSMCEAIRAFAEQSLPATGAAELALAHADLLMERARTIADDDSDIPDAADDWENLRAALLAGVNFGRYDVVLHTTLALDILALGSGLGEAQLAHLDEALRRGAANELGLLCRALLARSGTLYALGRLLEARRDAETALLLANETNDAQRAGLGHRMAAQAAFQLGDLDGARAHLLRARDIERGRGEPRAIATVHCQLGSLHNSVGELDLARDAFERSLVLAHGAGDPVSEALALMGLAWNHFESGERETARDHYEHALAIVRRLRMSRSERIVIGYLGLLEFDAGNHVVAEAHLAKAALASRRAGDSRVEGIFEGVRGGVLASMDRVIEARATFDLADELLARNAFYQRAVRVHRGHLDLAEARAVAVEGHARAHVDAARWRIEEARSLARRSDDARMAIAILERAISRA